MLQINIYLRFGLMALSLIAGVVPMFIKGLSFWWGFPFLLVFLVLAVGYLLLGTINSAAMLLQEGNLDEAEKRLALTLSPKWLYSANRAYYFMLKGTIAMNKKDMEGGEAWLRKAQEVKLPTDNEKAMLELQLANIAASKGKWNQAQLHFRKLKEYKITETTIKDQVKQLEKALENRGQVKAAMRMGGQGGGMMMPGGKRKRPKMR
jgi:tetratricopeptide (TPR) repeat protein